MLCIIITKEQELLRQHGDWEVPCKRREKYNYSQLNETRHAANCAFLRNSVT